MPPTYAQQLARTLQGTPMAQFAPLIARVERRNKLPRGLLAGIGKAESSYGTAGVAGHEINPFGWMGAGGPAQGLMDFPDMAAAIRHVGNTLGQRGWDDPAEFGDTYVGESTWEQNWLPNVQSVMSQFGGGVPQGGGPAPTTAPAPATTAPRRGQTRTLYREPKALQQSRQSFESAIQMALSGGDISQAWEQLMGGLQTMQQAKFSVVTDVPKTRPISPQVPNVISLAKEYMGTPYVFASAGGRSDFSKRPDSFDCSGFIAYLAYKNSGGKVKLPAFTGDLAKMGQAVNPANLQAGDAVFFGDVMSGKGGHMGMYIGDGNFIHASSSGTGVKISDLSDYGRKVVAARRLPGLGLAA